MKFRVIHRSRGQFHIDLSQKRRLSELEADILYYNISAIERVDSVKVYPRTGQLVVRYKGRIAGREVIGFLEKASFEDEELTSLIPSISGRATNQEFKEKIITQVLMRGIKRWFLPVPIRTLWTLVDAAPFVYGGLVDIFRRNFSAEIVHATAILASVLTGDMNTASSITFLTQLGEILEEWTYKKSLDDLAQSLALNVSTVWKVEDGKSKLVGIHEISIGDWIQVDIGNMIPLDGVVVKGEGMVNQAALTGEPIAVHKEKDITVYAGTVLEEGHLVIEVRGVSGDTRYDKIVQMIEASESLVAPTQSQAEKLVSKLIPYTFGTAALTWLLTGNVTRAASVLMVDFSCAIEVAMPISVLTAMREAGKHKVTVKGGKFLEAIAEADTIVFDKTGTLTKAEPVVETILTLNGHKEDEMLRLAASLEEHFPHSLANAIVSAADERKLSRTDLRKKPEYIVAHGIASEIRGKRVVLGSYHFVFEDELVGLSKEEKTEISTLPEQYSLLYLAIGGKLAAVFAIADPLKEETPGIIRQLRELGFDHLVMMTGDSERTAKAIAAEAGIQEYYAEVLPEDKANYVEEQKSRGRKVIMIGDGINDSPALSAADVGIAIQEGADIAQEIADITISGQDLQALIELKLLSDGLMKRMRNTGRVGIAFNAGILLAGLAGLTGPGTAALLHNASTIGLCLRNMTNMLPEEEFAEEEIIDIDGKLICA